MASVYVVEDDPTVRLIVARMLQVSGCQVRTFGSSEEAADALAEDPPDVALVDVSLPLASGIELAAFIRALGTSTRVLFMSGFGPDDLDRIGLEVGVPLIYKPFGRDELPRAIRALTEPDSNLKVPRFSGLQDH